MTEAVEPKETIVTKTKRLLATLGVAAVLTGSLGACDHIKSDGSGKATEDQAKPKEAQNVMPGGDRYGGGAGAAAMTPAAAQ
jgi:hypothetical protein